MIPIRNPHIYLFKLIYIKKKGGKTYSKQQSEGYKELNIINQQPLVDIFRTFHPTIAKYMFFPRIYEKFSRQAIFGHKINLDKFKRIKIILPGHYRFKLKINNRKITEKSPNTWELKHILLNNPWMKRGKLRDVKKYLELNKN